MYYIKLISGIPTRYSIAELRKDNSNVSFPAHVSNELLAEYGVYPLISRPQCQFDAATEDISSVPVFIEGHWVESWLVLPCTPEQITLRNESMKEQVRAERNDKLIVSDWTQVADAPVDKAAWSVYRQALRDVTSQPGFPYIVEWPIAPI